MSFFDETETQEVPLDDGVSLVVGWAPRAKLQAIILHHEREQASALQRIAARAARGESGLVEPDAKTLNDPTLAALDPAAKVEALKRWSEFMSTADDPEYREHFFEYARDVIRWTVREAKGVPALATEEVVYQVRKYRVLTIEAADRVRDSLESFWTMVGLVTALIATQSVTEREKKVSSQPATGGPPLPPTGDGSAGTAPPIQGAQSSSGVTGSA